jgi:anti-sigma factor RsiW
MMSDNHERWTDRLSEYLDGTLDADARSGLESHLASCPACAAVCEELRQVVLRAHALGDVQPERDLWPAIAASLGTGPGQRAAEVIPLPTRRPSSAPGLYLTRRQLAAAAVVVALLSAALTWAAGPGLAVRPAPASLPAPAGVSPAASIGAPPPALAGELAQLQATLDAARDRLDPNTVRILEKNLDVINRAIEDSRRALTTDPANAFLREHLDRAYEQKVDYLREAAGIADWKG